MENQLLKIENVIPFISNGQQVVEFRFEESEKKLFLTGESIEEQTDIHITEVEILIGSSIKAIFNNSKGTTQNRNNWTEEHEIIKKCAIIKSADNQSMRVSNLTRLLYFNRIRSIYQREKKNGKMPFLVIELNNLTTISFNLSRFVHLTRLLPSEFYLMTGEYVSPVFYKKGELLEEEEEGMVNKENTIIRDLNLRITDTYSNFREYKKSKINPPYIT